jgi:hypothetical protein
VFEKSSAELEKWGSEELIHLLKVVQIPKSGGLPTSQCYYLSLEVRSHMKTENKEKLPNQGVAPVLKYVFPSTFSNTKW